MLGIVDVGGGERGVYGAGVLDQCLDQGISFDYCIGVSAGAANLVSYLAGQKGRNFAFYTSYSFRPQYMGPGVVLKKGEYADLDYIYGELSEPGGEYPLDFQAAVDSGKEFIVVATSAETGLPVYFTFDDMAVDDLCAIKASSALPIVCKPYPVHGQPCYDGGLSNPIPVLKAFEAGCEKVVLILTRPRSFRRDGTDDAKVAALIRPKYPHIAEALMNRAGLYNLQLDLAEKFAREGKVLIVAPDSIGDMKTLTKDKAAIEELYAKGYKDALAISDFIA